MLRTLKKSRVKNWELFDDGNHSLNGERVRRLTSLSRSRGLTFSIHGPICDLNLATLNSEMRPHVLRRMERSLRHSAALGARSWVLHPGTHGALSWVHRGKDWSINEYNLRGLRNLGRKLGVEVTLENIAAGNAILGRTGDFLHLYNEWPQAPRITLDVGHSHVRRETDQYLAKLGKRIGHVHAHDNKGDFDTHLAIGSGTIHWKELLRSLLETGFSGDIIVESVKGPFAGYERVEKILGSLQ